MIAGMNEYSSVGAARAVKAAKSREPDQGGGSRQLTGAVQLMEHGIFQGIVDRRHLKWGNVGVRETG